MCEDRKQGNKQSDLLPWYAGVNISSSKAYGREADELCSNYIQMLFINPQSRAIELILETLETHPDARLIAQCLSDAMAYIAHTPINTIKGHLIREYENPDYTTTHNFDHKQEELKKALRMSPEEFEAVISAITIISGEMFIQNLKKSFEVKIDPAHAAPIFERVLANRDWTDLQKATALYLFLSMPIRQELIELEQLNERLSMG